MNIEKALNSFEMQYTNITVDLQMNHTACLVQADCLPADSQRAPDRGVGAMGGLLCQAYTVVAHVPARRPER